MEGSQIHQAPNQPEALPETAAAEPEDNRLELFRVIEETADLLDENRDCYEAAAQEIINLLTPVLEEENNQVIAFKHRIKTRNSLKEKIIRRELYKQFKRPSAILASIPDVLGIMAECRFTADEVKIYTRLRENFFLTTEDGLFYDPALPNLFFWLGMPQPQIQKNGFEVYRVDGLYLKQRKRIRFELQIKSMVNSFWSEVEHELVYKNNSYLPDDEFVRNALDTLKNNLNGIDGMLQLLTERIAPKKEPRHIFADLGYGNFLARMISDMYMRKMADSLGFTVDFRKTCEVLGFYVARKSSAATQEELQNMLFRISDKFLKARNKDTNFEEKIVFERHFQADNQFSMLLGRQLFQLANTDYEWHVFFKMLFEIEDGSCIEDLELFVYVLYKAYSAPELYEPIYRRLDKEMADMIRDDILIITAEVLVEYGKIQMIYQETLNHMMDAIQWVASYIGEDGTRESIQAKKDTISQQFRQMLKNA